MKEFLALLRVGWLSALSYRLNLAFSLVGLAVSVVPLYFVAQALQPVAASSIAAEGGQYFAFVALGLALFTIVSTSLTALPNAIAGAISSGVLEAILSTRARLPLALLGMMGYELSWAFVRASVMLCAAGLLGQHFSMSGVPIAILALFLLLACYLGLGMALTAMVLVARTTGPIGQGILTGSALLGGVYYSTTVIPSWIQSLSVLVPLTYGLRAVRQALLASASLSSVRSDLLVLFLTAVVLVSAGALLFRWGLDYARREGTLGQY